MDQLFKRYADPFILLDNLIQTSSLSEFIDDMFKFINKEMQERTQWEFFLHRIYDESWNDFIERIKSEENSQTVDLGTTLKNSREMLINFTPEDEVI